MSNIYQKKKEVLAAEMARLEEEHGYLTPEILLESARPKSSVLHPYFTWDQKKAAEEYRLHEASRYIRQIKITVTAHDQAEVKVRQFVHVSAGAQDDEEQPRKGIYITIDRAQDEGRIDEVIESAKRELRSFLAKYRNLSKLSGVIDLIEAELEKMEC